MPSRNVRNVSKDELREKAKMIRREVVRLTDICGSGHYGSAFSIAELLAVLYYQLLQVKPERAAVERSRSLHHGQGPRRDRTSTRCSPISAFFRRRTSTITRGCSRRSAITPDMKKVKGADFSSGSIGHNLSVSGRMAAGLKLQGSPGRVVCMMGDGEQTEGTDLGGRHLGGPLEARQSRRPGRHQRRPAPTATPRKPWRPSRWRTNGRASAGTFFTLRRRARPSTTTFNMPEPGA